MEEDIMKEMMRAVYENVKYVVTPSGEMIGILPEPELVQEGDKWIIKLHYPKI